MTRIDPGVLDDTQRAALDKLVRDTTRRIAGAVSVSGPTEQFAYLLANGWAVEQIRAALGLGATSLASTGDAQEFAAGPVDNQAARLVDAWAGHDLAFSVVPGDHRPGTAYDGDDCGDELFHVFTGRVMAGGGEHFRFRTSHAGGHAQYLDIPAWRIVRWAPDATRLLCSAWQYSVDPRSQRDGLSHVDPAGQVPLALCPIHQL